MASLTHQNPLRTGGTRVTYLDSELELSSLESARFSWTGGDYRARPSLGPDLAERLLALESAPEAYGREIFEAVFPRTSELREGLREAILAAEREKSRLRFRLHLALDLPEWVHALYWELLTDPDRHLALARSPDTAFSRYLDVRRSLGVPAGERPRLLCVVSAPADISQYNMAEIRRDEALRSLESSLGTLADSVEVAFLEPPVTLARLRERLMQEGGFQLLHFFGHGLTRNGGSALVLENEQGRAHFVEEELLAEVFLGVHGLRLVTLVACQGGTPSSGGPFSGLAGRLVERGLPAVIAMRREVRVESAHRFTQHLYRHIALTGRADAAVNEARHQLYLAEPQQIDWSSPVLYSRLADGRLWLPRAETAEEPIAEPRSSLGHLRQALWVPTFLMVALFVLGLWPAARHKMHLDLRISQIAVWLEQNAAIIEHVDLVELAAARLRASRPPTSTISSPLTQPRDRGTESFEHAGGSVVSQATFDVPSLPQPQAARITLGDQGESSYRLTTADSDREPPATQSDVPTDPLGTPVIDWDRRAELDLVPQSGAAETDAPIVRVAPASVSDVGREDVDFVDPFPAGPLPSDRGPTGADSLCDPSLGDNSKSPMAYRLRGDRCEGIYAQQVSAISVEILSLVASFGPFDPAKDRKLLLAWRAPAGSERDVRLRAFSFKPRIYYRMDTAVPASRGEYRWPTDVLASVELGRDDLGLIAWINLPGSGGSTRQVYLPLRAGAGAAKADAGYDISLFPSVRLSEVRLIVSRLDDKGDVAATLQDKELGIGYYPAAAPTVFSTGKLGPAGFYRLVVTAVPKSGLSVEQDIEFYHPGD
jgi:hypothetical protein